jgi:hypothetical protein
MRDWALWQRSKSAHSRHLNRVPRNSNSANCWASQKAEKLGSSQAERKPVRAKRQAAGNLHSRRNIFLCGVP